MNSKVQPRTFLPQTPEKIGPAIYAVVLPLGNSDAVCQLLIHSSGSMQSPGLLGLPLNTNGVTLVSYLKELVE